MSDNEKIKTTNGVIMIIEPKILNNVCITAHPEGCKHEVLKQIEYVKSQPKVSGVKNALIIGSSGGYGLATRIALAYGAGAATMGLAFEKEATGKRTATPGWYNSEAFSEACAKDGIKEVSLNGDAFSNEAKTDVIEKAKTFFDGKIDLVIYSLASPVRTDPTDGITYRSVLKPLGKPFTGKTIDFLTEKISEVTIEPATDDELKSTVKVMGGEDWKIWIERLLDADLLADNAMTLAYSYIGPVMTHDVYKSGTIGMAKEHLETSSNEIDKLLKDKVGGSAYVSVNKALVTRASAVIPVVPLYIAILFKIMKELGTHEGCIEQAYRLVHDRLYSGNPVEVDDRRRIRIDDLEMRDEVQSKIASIWDSVNEDNLHDVADVKLYRKDYMNLHGFEVDGIDYSKDVEV